MKTKLTIAKNVCTLAATMALACGLGSCKNDDVSYGDYDYQTVYFAHQAIQRTITLGDDIFSTDLDNKHQFQVFAVMGGVESNKHDRQLTVAVNNDLCQGVAFADGSEVTPLPSNYYELGGNTITIPKGQVQGPLDVTLTDAFFADTLATKLHYALPLEIVTADDSILSGKDHIYYCVQYINKYNGCWLSKNKREYYTNGKLDSTATNEPEYWEYAEQKHLTTVDLNTARYDISTDARDTDSKGNITVTQLNCSLLLHFDDKDSCTITTATPGCEVTGSGQWTYQGEKNAWNKKDRDKLSLQYTITWKRQTEAGEATNTLNTTETLCMRNRKNTNQAITITKQ